MKKEQQSLLLIGRSIPHYVLLLSFLPQFISCGILFPRESETREVISLDGIWKFTISPEHEVCAGFDKKWFDLFHEEWMDMPVPASYNDITANATIRDFVGWAWYQRQFFVPRRWLTDKVRVFLRFGSVHYASNVWINGEKVAEHMGGHLPFKAEITKVLKFNSPNIVTVAVNNTLTSYTIPQGTVLHLNDTDKYPTGYVAYLYDFDFFNYAGIHRPVYLYTTPKDYIDDITVTTNIQNGVGIINYKIGISTDENEVPQPYKCEVAILNYSAMYGPSKTGCQGTITVEEPILWWPVHMHSKPGHMYTIQATLSFGTNEVDIYRLPVGIRTIQLVNNSLHINKKPCYLRGFGKHEDSNLRGKGLDNSLLIRDYSLIQWTGANSYRTSHYPYAEEALDIADRLGIMIIAESPAVDLDHFDDKLLDQHKEIMHDMIERDKNRPSVIMWSLSNEARTSHNGSGPYYKKLVNFVKKLDSTRLVTYVTNQPYHSDQAAEHVDVIGVNRYFAWYSDTGLLNLIPHQILNEFANWHEKFNKSVYISEYGADAISGFHTLPSAAWTEDYQATLMTQHFKAFDKLRKKGYFIGEMIWNFADFATKQGITRAVGNHKGIFTRERQPKEAALILRVRYTELAKQETQRWKEDFV